MTRPNAIGAFDRSTANKALLILYIALFVPLFGIGLLGLVGSVDTDSINGIPVLLKTLLSFGAFATIFSGLITYYFTLGTLNDYFPIRRVEVVKYFLPFVLFLVPFTYHFFSGMSFQQAAQSGSAPIGVGTICAAAIIVHHIFVRIVKRAKNVFEKIIYSLFYIVGISVYGSSAAVLLFSAGIDLLGGLTGIVSFGIALSIVVSIVVQFQTQYRLYKYNYLK